MCRGFEVAEWEAACIQQLLAVEGVTLELLIIDDSPPLSDVALSQRLNSLFNLKTFGWKLYQRLFLNRLSHATRRVDLSSVMSKVPTLRCRPVQSGRFVQRIQPDDVDAIKSKDLDFVLRFAFNILKGDVLQAARFGVWSFHHGDPERYRGLPPGFWEIYHRNPVTGTVLQRLTEKLDAGIMLHKGFFRTNFASYPRSRDTIFFGASDWPALLCRQIQAGLGDRLAQPASSTSAPIFYAPDSLQMLKFAWVQTTSWLREQWRSLFVTQQWSVGIVEAGVEDLCGLRGEERQAKLISSARWLTEPTNGFLADPFAVREDTGLTIFAEEYDWSTELGHISTVAVDESGESGPVIPVVKLSTHLSYPFLLTLGGKLTCVPESSQSNQVGMFQMDSSDGHWRRVASAFEGAPVIDPTIFWHTDRWWMFGGLGGAMDNTKLYAWHASEIHGPWHPHLANPIKTDVRCSRPAGAPFSDGGELFRPAQDCSTGYGAAVSVNRIIRLTPEEFEEEAVAQVRPDQKGRYPTGLHTINCAGDKTVIDGSRNIFLWRRSLRVLLRKISRSGI